MLLSIGDQVKPGSYRLHSVFKRVVNFEHQGRLISVVAGTIGPGPLNIVLRDLKLAQAGDRPGTHPSILKGLHNSAQGWIAEARGGDPTLGKRPAKVSNPEGVGFHPCFDTLVLLQVDRRTVVFAGHGYHFTSRHRYHSTIELQGADSECFQHNLSDLGEVLKQDAPPKSLAFLLDAKRRKRFRTGFERAYAEQIERGVRQVFDGHLLEGIRQLKGCGLGLTPAGDDFIAGLLIGLHVLQKLRGRTLQHTIDTVFRAARGKNIFSNTFLDMARRGLVFGRMKDLLLALTSGSEGAVRKPAEKLLAVGETSGADLATGFFLTAHNQHVVGRWRRQPAA